MTKTSYFVVLCLVSTAACNIKHWDDCEDSWSGADEPWPPPRPDPNGTGGSGNTGNGSGGTGAESTGGTANGGGGGGGVAGTAPAEPPPTPCSQESDCEPGFNCDYERGECVPADAETCPELESEADCDVRDDCVTVYAGINCSCGPECSCIGGEPGCVCESFAFFRCEPLEQ
jgi:hypothetical protein